MISIITLILTVNKPYYSYREEHIVEGQNFNNNGELNQPVDGLDDALLINAPRLSHRSKGEPIVDAGNGVRLLLGSHFFNEEEKAMKKAWDAEHLGKGGNSTGGTGSTNNAKGRNPLNQV